MKLSNSALTLVAANLLTLLGVFLFNWDVFSIIVLFWFENLIIGFWNVFKMAKSDNQYPASQQGNTKPQRMTKFPAIPFFMVHFGGFCLVHGIFLYTTFFEAEMGRTAFETVGKMFQMLFTSSLVFGAILLFFSHGYSYFVNYIGKKEYALTNVKQLLFQPYGRIVVVHMFIFAAANFLTEQSSEKQILIIPFVVLKTVIDLYGHIKQHKNPNRVSVI
jgi:hypothetical protein